jgi:hypothetical protein
MLALIAKYCRGTLTSCRVKSATASVTLEVFGFLMGDENLQIIEVTLAVVAPRPSEDLLDVRILSLALAHIAGRLWMIELITIRFLSSKEVETGLSRAEWCDGL